MSVKIQERTDVMDGRVYRIMLSMGGGDLLRRQIVRRYVEQYEGPAGRRISRWKQSAVGNALERLRDRWGAAEQVRRNGWTFRGWWRAIPGNKRLGDMPDGISGAAHIPTFQASEPVPPPVPLER